MSDQYSSFLGRGWKFPVSLDEESGKVMTVAYEEDIQEAIGIIIATRKGERVMRPDFGCDLHLHLFDVVDYTLLKQMESKVKQALILWEPRITDLDVVAEVGEEPQLVRITVKYTVRTTNNPFNLVFPFYINEGSI